MERITNFFYGPSSTPQQPQEQQRRPYGPQTRPQQQQQQHLPPVSHSVPPAASEAAPLPPQTVTITEEEDKGQNVAETLTRGQVRRVREITPKVV